MLGPPNPELLIVLRILPLNSAPGPLSLEQPALCSDSIGATCRGLASLLAENKRLGGEVLE